MDPLTSDMATLEPVVLLDDASGALTDPPALAELEAATIAEGDEHGPELRPEEITVFGPPVTDASEIEATANPLGRAAPLESLVIIADELVWRDEASGKTVLRGDLADGRRGTVVADLAEVELGIERRFWGRWVRDPRFGPQFVAAFEADPRLEEELARNYLASGALKHIGPATATIIAGAYGAETMAAILADPRVLLPFRGVSETRLPAIRRGLRETAHLAGIIGLLDPYGVSLGVARRIWRRHGAAAVAKIKADPWRLAKEIRGVGFLTADRIAQGLGIALDDPHRLDAALLEALRRAASEDGHTTLSESSLLATAAGLIGQPPEGLRARLVELESAGDLRRVADPPGWALPSLAAAEELIASKLTLLASFAEAAPLQISAAEVAVVEQAEGIEFDRWQRAAVEGALRERITVITGGPGTGKTLIVRAVVELAEKAGLAVALVSPTGRAAKRLSELTGRPAQTIHRWLRYHPREGFAGPVNLPDLAVIDEASMLDVSLAARVFAALPPYARLILVGDIDQLPAVGPGNFLGDIIACPRVAVFRLRHIWRQAAGSAVPVLAAQILAANRTPDFDGTSTRLVVQTDATAVRDWIVAAVAKRREQAAEIQVLAPMNRGACGVEALNHALQDLLNPAVPGGPSIRRNGYHLRPGDRLLVTGNDYVNELFNGDLCYLAEIHDDGSFVIDIEGGHRELPAEAAAGFSLAYAMTIHRAQGSEFPVVIVPMHASFYMLLERRLFYTAVSRAQRTVVVVGDPKAIGMAIGRHDPHGRRTTLRALLQRPTDAPAIGMPTLGSEGANALSALLPDPDFDF